jgi:hypothetical protein
VFVPLWHQLTTSVTAQRGFLHLQSLSLIIIVEFLTCKVFCQSSRLHCGLLCRNSEVLQLCLDSMSKTRVCYSRICKFVTGQCRVAHSFFFKSVSLLKILAARLVACSKLCTMDTQMLGTTIQTCVARASLAQWNK